MSHYNVHSYHIMGSRILSRSFTVDKWEDEEPRHESTSSTTYDMDVDPERALVQNYVADSGSVEPDVETAISDDDSEDGDDPENVAMVPMADMLNARSCKRVPTGCGSRANLRVGTKSGGNVRPRLRTYETMKTTPSASTI